MKILPIKTDNQIVLINYDNRKERYIQSKVLSEKLSLIIPSIKTVFIDEKYNHVLYEDGIPINSVILQFSDSLGYFKPSKNWLDFIEIDIVKI